MITCATWNIHRARGRDDKVDPDRIARAIAQDIAPKGRVQVLALQEADGECPPHAGILDLDRIADQTGLRHIHHDPALRWGPQSHGFLGAILFLDPAFVVGWTDVLDLPGHCHRGAVIAEGEINGAPLRLIVAHLSLAQVLRVAQMRIIGQYLRRRPVMQNLLMGDLNEWRPWSGLAFAPALVGRRFSGGIRRSFPSAMPLLPLDRIMSDAPGAVQDLAVLETPLLREASDHLPLTAKVQLVGK
jgi:endonuclease/exonuclease/phosphatase family metal-dependent hydrolase